MEKYTRHPNTQCIVCSKHVYKKPSQIKRNGGKSFCSTFCYGKYNRKEKPCLVCGELILARLNKKTCSRSCANKHREGIKYKIGRPRDKATTFRTIKLELLKIRGNECERCGYKKYEILQIHHKNKNRSDNSLSNLEIICPNCHYEEHYLEKSWLKMNLEN